MRAWSELVSAADAARLVGAIGGGYVLLGVAWAGSILSRGGPAADALVTGLLIAGPGLLVAYGGRRIGRNGLDSGTYPLVAGRTFLGIAALLAVVGLLALDPAGDVDRPFRAVAMASAIGAVGGLAVGTYEARARTRVRQVTRRNRELRRYETLVEEATDVNAVMDPDGTFRYLTPSSEHVLGYEPEELVGESAFEYIHPDDREAAMAGLGEAVEHGRSGPVEFRFRHADGSWVVLEGRGRNLLEDPDIGGVVAYTHDVTERRAYERELERYKTLAESASDVVVTIDGDSRIRSVNPAIADVFGYEPEEVVGEPLTMLMPESMRRVHRDAIDRYLETGERALDWENVELPGLHADGHEFPLAISFSEFEHRGERRFAGIIRDNTEQKRLEADLRRERDLRERIVETSPIGIVVFDRERTVTYLNDRAERLFGRSRADLNDATHPGRALDLTDRFGEPMATESLPLERVLASGEPVFDVEMRIRRPDGETVWIAVNGAPIVDGGEIERVVLTIEDVTERRHHRDRLVLLNDVSRDLMEEETAAGVYERVAEAAESALPLSLIGVERFDADRGELTTAARSDAVADRLDDGPFAADRGLPWQVYVDQERVVSGDLREESGLSGAETPLRSAIVLPIGEHGVLVAGSTEPDAFDEADVFVAEMLAADARSALDRVGRESTLRERTGTLERRNAALERLRRVNETIRGMMTDLIRASTREEVLQAVCDRLVTADTVRFAWVGSHDAVADEVVPMASAGVEEGYLSSIPLDGAADSNPAVSAVRTGETQVANAISGDPPFDPWQQAAMDRGYQAAIGIPIVYGETVYGVVGVYADRPDVFDGMEAAVLTELGETVGYALNALERKRALVGEASVELEFELRGGDPALFQFAADHDCDFAFERIVRRTGDRPGVFFVAEGNPDEVRALGERSTEIEDVRVVSERDGEVLFEATLRESAFLSSLLDRGAMPRTLRATGDEGRAVIRVPATSDVRQFVELFESRFEDVDLVGRREVDEPIRTPEEFEAEFRRRLTDRQAEVLETAYASGYFEWPRESSAQDVAASLDLSQPTVSRHVRAGERALFGLLFGEE